MKKLPIHRVRPDELDRLVDLCAEHAAFEEASYDKQGKAELLAGLLFAEQPRLYCLVAEGPDGDLVGYTSWTWELSTWDAKEFAYVDCLYLRPEVRYRGFGLALIKQMAVDMMAVGINGLAAQWHTPTFNDMAIRLYEALGAKRKDKARFYLAEDQVRALATRGHAEGYHPTIGEAYRKAS
jgi:ribosomal protein S18 acetylase RimI-like enzyme